MATENRSITKALGGAEDLLLGRIDKVTQTRNGSSYEISGIDVPLIAASTTAVSLIDISKHTRARVYSAVNIYTDYVYDSTAAAGLPSTGLGKWVVSSNSNSTIAITTVALLPSAETMGIGARAFVTDSSVSTFGSPVADGGEIKVPVYSDGIAWIVG